MKKKQRVLLVERTKQHKTVRRLRWSTPKVFLNLILGLVVGLSGTF